MISLPAVTNQAAEERPQARAAIIHPSTIAVQGLRSCHRQDQRPNPASVVVGHITRWLRDEEADAQRSEPWQETGGLLDDLLQARKAPRQAGQEPEAGQ